MSGAEEEVAEKQGFFSRPVSEIPCFRRSLLAGITGGLGAGVAYFMYSSNVRRATNVGFGSYILVTLGTWSVCRYQWTLQRHRDQQIQQAIKTKVAIEGTDIERQYEQERSQQA